MKRWIISAKNIKDGEPDIKWLISAEDEDEAAEIGFEKAQENHHACKCSLGVDQYPLDTEGHEDKEEIVSRFFDALRMTRQYMELISLEYSKETERVIAVFENGHKKNIDVACDSGIAIIKDILSNL